MNFVDIIGTIVTAVRAEYDPTNLLRPFYEYGHPIEIFNILAQKSESETFKYKKYPLIALYQDFEEDTNTNRVIVNGITIVIMTETKPEIEAKNRYLTTFTPK